MSVKIYRCPHCGNITMMLEDSGVVPVCCGDPMKEMESQTTDTLVDKHLPLVCCDRKNTVHVTVGKNPHPMSEEHYLNFIVLETKKGVQVHYLKPGELPTVAFHVCKENPPLKVYSYCNLNGLWVKPVECIPEYEESYNDMCDTKGNAKCDSKGDAKCNSKGNTQCESRAEAKDGRKKKCGPLIAMLLCLITPFYSCSRESDFDNRPVSQVDLNKYLGDWYEIARFDHRFERGLTHCKANYKLNDDGTIKVTNSGIKKGEKDTSEGKAKTTDEPGILRVSFFGPFYSDYRILMLAEDYSYALVGSSGDGYLWILSRTPELDSDVRTAILNEATRRCYNIDELIWVDQS